MSFLWRVVALLLSLSSGGGGDEREAGGRRWYGWTDAGVIMEAKHWKVVRKRIIPTNWRSCAGFKCAIGASETQLAVDVDRHLYAPLTTSASNHSDAKTSSSVSSRQVAHHHKYVTRSIKQMKHSIYNDINRRCFSSLNWVGWSFPPPDPDPVLPVRALRAVAHASLALSLPATQWCISHGASGSCHSLA